MLKLGLMSCVAVAALTGSAMAQTAPTATVEEVVVTANKRAENVQDVPKSVQVVGSQELVRNNITNITDLRRIVPSISGNNSGSTPSMRGVSTGASTLGANSKVGIVLDDVPQTSRSTAISNVTDIERIEVLPGPQGTLSGRNATGGLINIVTAGPTSSFAASGRVTATSDHEYLVNAIVSGPITDDLAFSLSATERYFRGLREDKKAGVWDDEHLRALRGKLRWTPNEDLTVTGTLFAQVTNNSMSTLGAASQVVSYIAPGNFLTIDTRTPKRSYAELCPEVTVGPDNTSSCSEDPGRNDEQTFSGNFRVDYDLGGPTLSSISAFADNKRKAYTVFQVLQPNPELNFRPDYDGYDHLTDISNFVSQEFRITSPSAETSRLNYVAGVYYQKVENARLEDRRYLPDVAKRYFDTKSMAAFAHVGYKILDPLTIEGGLRYEKDEVSYLWIYEAIPALPSRVVNGQTLTFPAVQVAERSSNSYSDGFWNYDASIKYKVMEDVLLYTTYSKASQGPVFDPENNLDSRGGRKLQPLLPEEVKNVEVGVKSQWFDRRLTLNASVFDAKYQNYQQQNLTLDSANPNNPPQIRLSSVGAVSTRGVEIQATAAPTRNLRLNASAAFLDTNIDEFNYANCYNGQTEATGCVTLVVPGETVARRVQRTLAGRELPSAPKFRGVIGASYTFPEALAGADVVPSFNYSYQTKTNTDILGSPTADLKAVGRMNADVSFNLDRLSATLFVNNVFENKAETYGVGLTGFSVNNVIGAIRTRTLSRDNTRYWGVRLSARY
jgi:iron complex outermembrane receptor protein